MEKRVLIVDYNHLAHIYYRAKVPPLSHTLKIGDTIKEVDTTIPAYTIKQINRWSNNGENPTAICFDSPCPARKEYFLRKGTLEKKGKQLAYKDGRASLPYNVLESIGLTMNLLTLGGVNTYKKPNFEADDLVKLCVDEAKKAYPDLPIDIVCNDADLLPLVDDQVSVFIRSVKYTSAESKELEKRNYIQVTPSNYQKVIEGMSKYKNISVPYNTILLAKILRGDDSDSLKGHPDYKPKIYKDLIWALEYEAQPLYDLFRYGDEDQLEQICYVLGQYVDPEDLDHVRFMYRGMNLNCAFTDLSPQNNREPAKFKNGHTITGYESSRLQAEVSKLGITLPNAR